MIRLVRIEVERLSWRVVGAALALGALLLAVSHVLIPRLPPLVTSVLETAFAIEGTRAVLLLNDHLATYAVVFVVGVGLLNEAIVAPRETRQMALWLSKPVTRRAFLGLRTLPSLGAAGLVGVAMSALTAMSVALTPAGGDATVAGALAGGLALTACTLVVLVVTLGLQVVAADGFQALLVAFVVWMLPLLPASVLIYRPDVFAPYPLATRLFVTPANLLWWDAHLPIALVPVAALAALVGVALFTGVTWVFERRAGD